MRLEADVHGDGEAILFVGGTGMPSVGERVQSLDREPI
jgi:hypothetical protein